MIILTSSVENPNFEFSCEVTCESSCADFCVTTLWSITEVLSDIRI